MIIWAYYSEHSQHNYYPEQEYKIKRKMLHKHHIHFRYSHCSFFIIHYTGCPKIKSALGKHLQIAVHGFKMCVLDVKRDARSPLNAYHQFRTHWTPLISITNSYLLCQPSFSFWYSISQSWLILTIEKFVKLS